MTSTLRPSLSSKLSFRLVDLTISFAIEQLAILSKLIHWIATCIANDAATKNSSAAVPSSPTTPHFGSPLGAPVRFLSLVSFSSFILMFFTRCKFGIHRRSVTHSRMSSTARQEVLASTPTTQTTVTVRLDVFL
jgi:hypothetical protein